MRRITLILALLVVAAPALATVTITVEVDGAHPRKVLIGYESDEAELVRAFALDITVADGNIVDINDYAVGDDNGGYGIFPGSFSNVQIDAQTGAVVNWDIAGGYSPVAPAGDPDALGGIGTRGVTIEMGSLYDTLAPSASSGILCSVTVDEDATELCVTANAIRGNVVLENATQVQNIALPDCSCVGDTCGIDECFPFVPLYERQYADWVALGMPICWCGHRYPEWRYQCDGDADAKTQVIGWRVYSNDLICIANNWQIWPPDPCCDFDHRGQVINWRVYSNDLVILANNWQKKDSQLPGDCPRPD